MNNRNKPAVTLETINAARKRIEKEIIRTPLVLSEASSAQAGISVHLKLENLQRTGAFKVRGALSKVSSLSPELRRRGLICASSGNHGLGVAHASSRFRAHCVVVLPVDANPYKVSLLEELGAEIVRHGTTSDARQEKVNELVRERGYTQIHPFADPEVIAGQGTIGLEILEDLPQIDEVYVPIGGGGLISGIATALKEQSPQTRIYGVEPEHSNAMSEALRRGTPYALPQVRTIADGLAARITEELNLSLVQRYVDDIQLVSDQAILAAAIFLLERGRVLVEPSAAAGLAGLLRNEKRRGNAVVVVSGGNVALQQLDVLRKTLSA